MADTELDPENVRVGATVRALSRAHGWTVGELAKALDISHAYVSNIMAGRKPAPPKLCIRIAKTLNVPLAAIVSEEYAHVAEPRDALAGGGQ